LYIGLQCIDCNAVLSRMHTAILATIWPSETHFANPKRNLWS